MRRLLLAVILLHISHQVDAECHGGRTSTSQDDAVLVCPLKEDASRTKQAVAVDYYYSPKSRKELVFRCFWENEDCPTCSSDDGFELLGNITSVLIARVPAAKLQNGGSYMSQFLVHDLSEPQFLCQAITPAPQHALSAIPPMGMSAKRSTTEPKASVPFTSDDETDADGQQSGLIVGIIILAVALCLLLAVLLIIVLRNGGRIRMGANSTHNPGTASSQDDDKPTASDALTA